MSSDNDHQQLATGFWPIKSLKIEPRKARTHSTESEQRIGMERQKKIGAESIALLLVVMLANGVDSQSLYACWGACYNNCFINSGKTLNEKFSCDYQCLKSCNSPSPSDIKFYCRIGCSLKRCIPDRFDGARIESCFGWCTNLCDQMLAA